MCQSSSPGGRDWSKSGHRREALVRVQVRDNLGPAPEDPSNVEFVRRLIRSVESASPGARAAAVTHVPLSGNFKTARVVNVDGLPVAGEDGRETAVAFDSATPSYLGVMGIPVTRGRGLAESDAVGAPLVIVVSEAAARLLWPDAANPVGRRVTLDPYGANRPKPPDAVARPPAGPQILEFLVVGVVGDVRASGAHTRARPEVYVSYWQVPWPDLHVVVHAPGTVGVSGDALRRAVAELDSTVPVGEIRTVEGIAGASVGLARYETAFVAIFGVLAAFLAVIGCYGVMAYAVSQRTREIGIRMALGASRRRVAYEVLGRGAAMVGWGLAAGAATAFAVTRVLASALYGVSPTDAPTFALAGGVLAIVSLGAAWLPARRAAAIEPLRTLKEE